MASEVHGISCEVQGMKDLSSTPSRIWSMLLLTRSPFRFLGSKNNE